jgi:hypothetical protein
VQIVRPAGGAPVLLDNGSVDDVDPMDFSGWEVVGEWEVGTVKIQEGAHTLTSTDDFGIMQYGYSPQVAAEDNSAGYGYMGGMKAEVIFVP